MEDEWVRCEDCGKFLSDEQVRDRWFVYSAGGYEIEREARLCHNCAEKRKEKGGDE